MREFNASSGYQPCGCRDCFDVAIGYDDAPVLCGDCEDAGCDASGDGPCERTDADEFETEVDAALTAFGGAL